MQTIWHHLRNTAIQSLNPRTVSPWIEVGSVASAIESGKGRIFTGVCVDTACSLGICAERSAIFQLLAAGENEIRRIVTINTNGELMPPCGACCELIAQMMPSNYQNVECFLKERVVSLGELLPHCWF